MRPSIRSAGVRVFVAFALATTATVAGTSRPAQAVKRENQAAKRTSKLDRELQRQVKAHGDGLVRVIVKPAPGRHDTALAKHRAHGDAISSDFKAVDAFAMTISANELDALQADPDVASLSADAFVTSDAAAEETADGIPSPLLGALGLDEEDDQAPTGQDVGIAVIDSGLERGSDLDGGEHDDQYDVDGAPRRVAPYDDYGHGTHVTGLISGSGKGSEGEANGIGRDGRTRHFKVHVYRGVAPRARIISLKVLGSDGGGRTSDVIQAIEFAIENRSRLKIKVINLSLGHPIYESRETDPLVQVVEAAVRAGIVVVTSAGNFGTNPETGLSGYAGITSPGNAPSAITVGAVDTRNTASRLDDRIASVQLTRPDLVRRRRQA